MSMRLVLFVLSIFGESYGLYRDFLGHRRENRHCHHHPAVVYSVENDKVCLVFILLSGILFFLIFLGLIKGLIGLFCWSRAGTYGLNYLIDLPRPLPQYQEKALISRTVVYDIGGWPVHPDTLKRTVRVLSKRTEFCLNLIFFLAYPLAACVYLCAICCCIKNLSKSQEHACFKHVDVIRLTQDNSKMKGAKDVYREKKREDQDTKYVIEAMKKSRESINEYHVKLKSCSCH